MASWDQIYRDFKSGGEAWATLGKGIDSDFVRFVEEKSGWPVKRALDVGCGTGGYIKFLRGHGFEVEGLDASETAIELAGEYLGGTHGLVKANMFDWDYPENKYGFIYSVAALHHGSKRQVSKAIQKIYPSLLIGGIAYITLPDIQESKFWETFKSKKKVGEGVFVPTSGPEKGVVHSFFREEEIEEMFESYKIIDFSKDKLGRWIVVAKKR